MEQLASLDNVKVWLEDANSTTNDALITRLIQEASRFILNYIQRPTLFKKVFTEVKDGLGNNAMMLQNYPVTSISELIVGSDTIPASASVPSQSPGYVLAPWDGFPPGSPQSVQLAGYTFWPGMGNIKCTYTAGFFVTDESATVDATTLAVTVQAPNGPWGRDDGVTLANGTALTKVDKNPAAMQYTADSGVYTFNVAQASAAVLISYSYIPSDIEQACIDLIAEKFRYKKRIGQQSVSAAGQITTSFSLKSMPENTREILDRYKRSFYQC